MDILELEPLNGEYYNISFQRHDDGVIVIYMDDYDAYYGWSIMPSQKKTLIEFLNKT